MLVKNQRFCSYIRECTDCTRSPVVFETFFMVSPRFKRKLWDQIVQRVQIARGSLWGCQDSINSNHHGAQTPPFHNRQMRSISPKKAMIRISIGGKYAKKNPRRKPGTKMVDPNVWRSGCCIGKLIFWRSECFINGSIVQMLLTKKARFWFPLCHAKPSTVFILGSSTRGLARSAPSKLRQWRPSNIPQSHADVNTRWWRGLGGARRADFFRH